MRRTFLSFQAAVYLILLVTSADASAALIRVCDGVACDHPTIQEAIDAATPGDTILVNKLIHTESRIEVTKDLTIKGIGQHVTVVQAANDVPPSDPEEFPPTSGSNTNYPGRVFDIGAGIQAIVRDLTIRHGFPSRRSKGGGGIRNSGNLTLVSVTVEQNATYVNGGGIENTTRANLVAKNSILQNNFALGLGGGMANTESTARLAESSKVHNNRSSRGGGGIYNFKGELFVQDSEIAENRTLGTINDGGGIASKHGAVSINQSELHNNKGSHGGAIKSFNDELDIVLTTIKENSASRGGGASISGGVSRIVASTFDRNKASGSGGGLATSNAAEVVIQASTFSRNQSEGLAVFGTGIDNRGRELGLFNSTVSGEGVTSDVGVHNGFDSVLRIVNTTIAKHEDGVLNHNQTVISNSIVADSNRQDCRGTPPRVIGPNLSSDSTCSGFSIPSGNAELGPLADNGGPTQTHALLEGSQAIGESDNTICALAPISAVDQRDVPRPQPLGGDCDLGAYEAADLVEQVAMAILFGGQGAGIATWLHGICETDGSSQQGNCSGPVAPPANVAIHLEPLNGAALGNVNVIGAAHSLVDNQDGTYTLNVEVNSAESDIAAQIELDPPPEFTLEIRSGGGNGIGNVRAIFNQMFVINCVVSGNTISPDPCHTEESLPEGVILVIRATADTEEDFISAWTGCDDGFATISPDGQSGECAVTMNNDRLVTVKIDRAQAPSDEPEVAATNDQGLCPGGFEDSFFNSLTKFNGVLAYLIESFDPLSSEFHQCALHHPWSFEVPSVFLQTGDMVPNGGTVGQISALRNGGVDEQFSQINEEFPDGSLESPWHQSNRVNGVWAHKNIIHEGQTINPTVATIGKVATNVPYFVVQAEFVDEGAGLVSADLIPNPVELRLLFMAGDPVGDGFTFDAFHVAAQSGIALNPLGDGAVIADVIDPASGSAVDAVLTYRADTPGASLLLHEGQDTETPGVFISRLIDVAMDGDGVIAALGRVSGTGISSTNDEAVWVCMAALCSIAVQEGMEPDGMPGVRLRFPGSPVVRGGMLLMRTVLEGAGIDSTNNNGILLVDLATGAIRLAAQKGDAFAGSTIADFTSKAFSNDVPLVVVRLASIARALARIDSDGLVPLIAPGDEFTLPDGTVGVVSGVIDITETGGEDGRPSAVGGGGYAIVVNFDDGRQGIVACTAACLEGGG